MKLFALETKRKLTPRQLKELYRSIQHGMKDGLLSIQGAKRILFLSVEFSVMKVLPPMTEFKAKDFKLEDTYEEYQVFIAPEPMSGRKKVFNTFALHRGTGQILVLGRELPYGLALDVALGRKYEGYMRVKHAEL